ncbi:MAG: TldD/PmbA family protein [Oligosphaeraceae bacterium]|nr:TldD/PmbA family protein [Oligosphaeraceae bacterium]
MKDRLRAALQGCPADYAEIRFEEYDGSSFGYRGKDLDTATTACSCGGVIRACVKGGWGTCVFDTLDNLRAKVWEACADAALVGQEKTLLAEVPIPPEIISLPPFRHDFREVSISAKLSLLKSYNDIILHHNPAIESSSVNYSEGIRTIYFASTRGVYHQKRLPKILLSLGAFARQGDQVQRAHESFSSGDDYQVVLGREQTACEIAQRAAALLQAPKCEGGRHTVVLRPDFAGVFIHEAFGHLSEADFLYENDKMRALMQLGRKVGGPALNVYDDGTLPGLAGTLPVDDEGTPPQRTALIRDGVLAGHLHSLETAGKMGARPTGNARTVGRHHVPIVRMTNTFIDNGPLSKEELFAGVDDGIYACGLFGGQTMMEMFTFSAAYAYRIKNGQLGELVRDVVMSGNVFQTLHTIDGIANDLTIVNRGGGCGKNGQAPLPVTFGGPHIRIQDVLIGGK